MDTDMSLDMGSGIQRERSSQTSNMSQSSPITGLDNVPSFSPPEAPAPVTHSVPLEIAAPGSSEAQLQKCSNCSLFRPIADFVSHTGRTVKKCIKCRPAPTKKPRNAEPLSSTPETGAALFAKLQPQGSRQPISQSEATEGTLAQAPPQIYFSVHCNVEVYDTEINGTTVMQRRADSWMNVAHIPDVANVRLTMRREFIQNEIITGKHKIIKGDIGKFKGTWVSYEKSLQICRKYGVEELLRPILTYDLDGDEALLESMTNIRVLNENGRPSSKQPSAPRQ